MVAKTKSKAKTTQTKSKPGKSKSAAAGNPKGAVMENPKVRKPKRETAVTDNVRVVHRISAPNGSPERKLAKNNSLRPQYAYMRAPGMAHDFQVGDTVEVFCDHEKNRERVRGWISGIVVQVDNKMVAVQFRSNVFLTDGWMVPDRILWYPLSSEHIRPLPGKKSARREEKVIPDY
ncbi:MAG TPA: hypothetical protein VFR47_00555 [Anaerolineales bacterium]|nr:hypothetical protein [Anaerolineales bacterium]